MSKFTLKIKKIATTDLSISEITYTLDYKHYQSFSNFLKHTALRQNSDSCLIEI